MRKLLVATRNSGKMPEMRLGLQDLPFELLTLDEAGVPKDFDVEETADSFEGNAIIKAQAYGKYARLLTIADDSGLCVDALDGNPGVKSARYAPGSDRDRYVKLLEEMKNVPDSERGAHFADVIAIYDPSTEKTFTTEGRANGRITREPKGEFGFGYVPVFYSEEIDATFGEVPPEEKLKWDHRGRALAKAREILKDLV